METKDYFAAYISSMLEHGDTPPSVFRFCKDLEVAEAEFYQHFASFEALESDYWQQEVVEVATAIREGGEWEGFDARQKMLTFLYALVARALDQRSFLLLRFQGLSSLSRPGWLAGWMRAVKEFTQTVVNDGLKEGTIADRGRMQSVYADALAMMTRSVIDYFVRDTSKGFEKTDAYIEKSCALAFDLMKTQALDSAFDLLKFLVPMPGGAARKRPKPATAEA